MKERWCVSNIHVERKYLTAGCWLGIARLHMKGTPHFITVAWEAYFEENQDDQDIQWRSMVTLYSGENSGTRILIDMLEEPIKLAVVTSVYNLVIKEGAK